MKVNEIFTSLSGEPDGFGLQGALATFIRLQGCNLKCSWCDTTRAQDSEFGYETSVEEVVKQCITGHVIITGGEPLCQLKEVTQLVRRLVSRYQDRRKQHFVTVETNGSILIPIDEARTRYNFLRYVVDYKLDKSGMNKSMRPEVFDKLYPLDVIKFVVADLQDYRQAKELVWRNCHWRAKKVFSPVAGGFPRSLAKAMVDDKLEGVTFALQWHKLLNLK